MNFKKIATIFFVGFFVIMSLIGDFGKLTVSKAVVEAFTPLGVLPYSRLLGAFDLTFVILFLIPVTRKIGFALSSCYLAGAMATHISHQQSPRNPAALLIILWIAAFLLDRSIFLYAPRTQTVSAR